MTKATTKSLNALHRGQPLAAEVPALNDSHIAWVGVHPLDLTKKATRELLRNNDQSLPPINSRVYRIRLFEALRSLIEEDVWVSERDLIIIANKFAYGDDQLLEILSQIGISFDSLEPSYKSTYPI
jgi:hypothetical protein